MKKIHVIVNPCGPTNNYRAGALPLASACKGRSFPKHFWKLCNSYKEADEACQQWMQQLPLSKYKFVIEVGA